ncbi:sigma-70 family RNA polymerase sigma factor [Alteromonas pelagimontana]|uniref:Sigma-70 family RNA polymerase sigma factor n=1 Tax=Alteromonas pelagimontana TaxID=1858656 RepID=A0A6M4MF98_9ALTE|nr:sigma-70 family RNA polymerase sigma factor [Alteromonas pelagimontana]QJR81330.1 sigma-70 family RNA polymerase sigma factor [Alteromonas pelagimontana]
MDAISTTIDVDVLAAKGGDIKAFERLVFATSATISSIALAIVKDLDASEEVTQQVYISCWKNLSTLKNNASFLPWLRQSTRYAALNYLRDNRTKEKACRAEADEFFAQFVDASSNIECSYQRKEQQIIIRKLLNTLPEETREVLLLYYREEQSTVQVASLLSLSEAAVRQKLSRARSRLKEQLLSKYGKVIVTTTPTIAFTSMALGSLSVSAPAKAAVTASGAGSLGKVSVIGSVKWLFSGATLGAAIGGLAICLGYRVALTAMTDEKAKVRLTRVRNYTLLWLVLSAALLGAAYELTSGWLAPVFAYSLFAIGLVYLTRLNQQIIFANTVDKFACTTMKKRGVRAQKVFTRSGLYGGLLAGMMGVIIGLINSGRMIL